VTYRPVPKPVDFRFVRARGDRRRFLCWVFGHRWRVVCRDVWRHMALVHAFTRAGEECVCERCGRHEDDRSRECRIAVDGCGEVCG